MCKTISLTLFLSAFAILPNGLATAPNEKEILRVEREACDAYLHADADYLARFFTDDFVFTGGDAAMTNKTEELAEVSRKEIVYSVFENREMVVRQHGDLAVITGITAVEGKPLQGERFAGQVRFTDVLTRIDGKWRMVATHVSDIPKKEG